jgi:hypothetical protein
MGGTAVISSPRPSTIGNAYLAQVLKGAKREVDSSIEIECLSSEEAYNQWNANARLYRSKLKQTLPQEAEALEELLLFPESSSFQNSQGMCGEKQGRVVLSFSQGLLSLEESKSLHIQENTPFTPSEVWNLLCCLLELNLLVKKARLSLDLSTESIYVDLRTKLVKLRNPSSFLGGELGQGAHEKYMDPDKLELVLRKLKVPEQVKRQNDDFNIGMLLVEVMLLESSCPIYDDGLTSHRTINLALH